MAELRHYRYFVEIAKRGTFTAAAEALNMTQSALSEQILQLERECGSMLFNRRHSGTTLTPAGEYLLHQAEALLAQAAETREGLAAFRHGYQSRLRLASVLGPLQSWVPRALAQFVRAEPQVQLQVQSRDTVNEILADVAADLLDLGIVSLRPSAPARSRHHELSQTVLVEEELAVLVPGNDPLAGRECVGQEDLRPAHLITFPTGYVLRQIVEDWFRGAGIVPIVAAETGAIEVMLSLVEAGVGAAIVPRSLARRGEERGMCALRLPPEDSPRRIVAAVRRVDGRNAELVDTLIEMMVVHATQAGRSPADGVGAPLRGGEGRPV
jgi:DNA-binding transcriptional LysR family regulator